LDHAEIISKNTFPEEPLDPRDRKLIQVIYGEGAKGIGFNRLVEKTRDFASRSTVAMTIERLVRLGYLEKRAGRRPGKVKPVRLTYRCYTFMTTIENLKVVAGGLESKLKSMDEKKSLEKEELKKWWREFRERYNSFFGMVGSMAMFYGTAAAGDLFLPLVVEDYTDLSSKFMSVCRERPELLKALRNIMDEQATSKGIELEKVRREAREKLLSPAVYRFRDWDDGVDLKSG
jgi:DNA-binding Lrp family transcriptional regulator